MYLSDFFVVVYALLLLFVYTGAGDPRGPGGAPRIQDLCSKFFENCQNLIFPIIRAP